MYVVVTALEAEAPFRCWHTRIVQYRPLLVSQVAHAVLGVVPAAVAFWLLADDVTVRRAAAASALVIAGGYVVIRAFCLGVDISQGSVITRGLLWSRRIPMASVSHVTDFPAIVWRDGRGRSRWTPQVGLLTYPRMLAFVVRHNLQQVARLSRALGLVP